MWTKMGQYMIKTKDSVGNIVSYNSYNLEDVNTFSRTTRHRIAPGKYMKMRNKVFRARIQSTRKVTTNTRPLNNKPNDTLRRQLLPILSDSYFTKALAKRFLVRYETLVPCAPITCPRET